MQQTNLLPKRTAFQEERANSVPVRLNLPAVQLSAFYKTHRRPHEHARVTHQEHATTHYCMPLHLPGTSADQPASSSKCFLLYFMLIINSLMSASAKLS